jgi:hypothetical protein
MKNAVFWAVTHSDSCKNRRLEGRNASIIRVTRIGELGTTLAMTILFSLIMEVTLSSEMSVLTRATRRHIPLEGILYGYLMTMSLHPPFFVLGGDAAKNQKKQQHSFEVRNYFIFNEHVFQWTVKVQLNLSQCSTKHYTMMTYGGWGCIDPRYPDLSNSCRWVIAFTSRAL